MAKKKVHADPLESAKVSNEPEVDGEVDKAPVAKPKVKVKAKPKKKVAASPSLGKYQLPRTMNFRGGNLKAGKIVQRHHYNDSEWRAINNLYPDLAEHKLKD